MIAFVIGTTAELIKIQPVHRMIRERGNPVEIWCTNQQPDDLAEALEDFNLSINFLLSDRDRNLRQRREVPAWATGVLVRTLKSRGILRQRLSSDALRPLLMVHGDTMTSVLGCLAARIVGASVGHIEAGLRSWDIRNPFPEELNRRAVGRLARLHYAPDEVALRNLKLARGQVVNTRGNTVVDALKEFHPGPTASSTLLVSLHRSELLSDAQLLERTVEEIIALAETVEVRMIVDSLTTAALSSNDLFARLTNSPVMVEPKKRYVDFMQVLANSSAVITDSGGLQEECAALGKPCLVYRNRTERQDGLGENAVLAGLQPLAIPRFGHGYASFARRPVSNEQRPTAIIVDDLVRNGYIH